MGCEFMCDKIEYHLNLVNNYVLYAEVFRSNCLAI